MIPTSPSKPSRSSCEFGQDHPQRHTTQEYTAWNSQDLQRFAAPTSWLDKGTGAHTDRYMDQIENRAHEVSKLDSQGAVKTDAFTIWTSQETDTYIRSAADGLRGNGWRNDSLSDKRIYEQQGTFRVELARASCFHAEPVDWEQLERLTGDQNGDFAFAFFYIATCLSPAPDKRSKGQLTGKIDLNDLIAKIGWLAQKPDAAKLEELRQKIWRFLVYGEEAVLIGSRSITYRDPDSKQEISTRIESAPWKIIDSKRPADAPGAAPLWVKITINREWETVFSDARLAQYMPLGECLGTIPPYKAAGDWARLMGLTLAIIWRCNTREAPTGGLSITRRDILTRFAPKTQRVEDILASKDPKHAVKYYRDALDLLVGTGLVAPMGDAAPDVTANTMLSRYKRQGWQRNWLLDQCHLIPGDQWQPTLQALAQRTFTRKPRDLRVITRHNPMKLALI